MQARSAIQWLGAGALSVAFAIVGACSATSTNGPGNGLDAGDPQYCDQASAGSVDGGSDPPKAPQPPCTCCAAGGTPSVAPTAIATALQDPRSIAVDALNVYWTMHGGSGAKGTVMRAPLDGGTPAIVAASQDLPDGIEIDAVNVYWANGGGAIMSAPIAGGVATAIATGQSPRGPIAIDATNIYWANFDSVMRAPLGGGVATPLATGQAFIAGLAVDATSAYWSTPGNTFDGAPALVKKVPLAGGAPSTVASARAQISGSDVVVDAGGLYWTVRGENDKSDGVVMALKSPGAPIEIACRQATPTGAIAVDATHVYWANWGGHDANGSYTNGAIMKAPRAGGAATVLVTAQPAPSALRVDATSVYWRNGGDRGDGTIMRVPK